jgi:autotransporter-associated beta strand protein
MRVTRCALLAITWGGSQPTWGIEIPGYEATVNNRFESGFPSHPTGNTGASYLGVGFDLSGAGWAYGTGLSGTNGKRMQNITLLTPLHVIQPSHYGSRPDTPFLFLGTDNTLYSATVVKNGTFSTTIYSNDITVGTLSNTFSSDQSVSPYRILDVRTGTYEGLPMLVYGSEVDNQGARIALATGGTRSSSSPSFQNWASGVSSPYLESGDSGSPAFVIYTAPDGTRSLTFAGGGWYPRAVCSLLPSGSNYNPVAGINNLTKNDGYAVKWTVYESNTDIARAAPQWVGTADNAVFNAANWSQGTNPGGLSVVFDTGSHAGGSTSLNISNSGTLRGMLFHGDEGFTFSGPGKLTIGQVGLRNESTTAQTFNVDVSLGDSQNWEAAKGSLIFHGDIDTTSGAHLLVIGGDADTVINGMIGGAGSLAKDDTGTLTLNAENSYGGKTWVHHGTLRVGVDQALPETTEVIFDTTNPASLDLSGHNLKFAALRSNYGGTGRVDLGGGSLTIDTTSSNSYYDGDIQGEGVVVKTSTGLLVLSGTDTHSGSTRIEGGVLRVASAAALSEASSLELGGNAVLELGAGNFHATLGTGAGQVNFAGTSGFSAYGGERTVTLNNGAAIAFDQAGFLSGGRGLILGSSVSNAMVDFTNDLILGTSGSGMRSLLATGNGGRLSGDLTDGNGTFGINKYNGGLLELSGNNTYKGATAINGGTLRVASASSLPTATRVILNGGVLELGHSDYNASLGTGTGQVRFTGNGGFSAYGADRTVNLGGAATPMQLQWGSTAYFLGESASLYLSSNWADATLDLRNPISLGSATGTRTVRVYDGSAAVDARLSGSLTEGPGASYGLTKTGAGTLELTAVNAWTGDTVIQEGVLRLGAAGALPTTTALVLAGGVLELGHSDYVATLGSSAGQVRFSDHGGFSAAGADRHVRLNSGTALTWGTGSFIASGKTLYLSSQGSDATVTLDNGIVLGTSGSGTRTIHVADGGASVDARLSGNLTQSGGSFGISKTGAGTLEVTGSNNYTGSTSISGGALRVSSAGALPGNSMIILNGGVLELAYADFRGTIGTDISFATHGGFSAAGATRRVILNNGAAISWTSTSSLSSSVTLKLSSSSADSTIDFTNPLIISGGPTSRTIEVADGVADIDARLSGSISQQNGDYGVIKTGKGTLELATANTYKGTTEVTAGRLLVNGNQANATGQLLVHADAILGGNGIIGGSTIVFSGGMLNPGDMPAQLNFNDSLTLATGSHFLVVLDNGGPEATAGFDYTHLGVSNQTIIEDASLLLVLSENFSATANTGSVFNLIASDTLQGSFLQGDSIFADYGDTRYSFGIDYLGNAVNLTLENISLIPEPVTSIAFIILTMIAPLCVRKSYQT